MFPRTYIYPKYYKIKINGRIEKTTEDQADIVFSGTLKGPNGLRSFIIKYLEICWKNNLKEINILRISHELNWLEDDIIKEIKHALKKTSIKGRINGDILFLDEK